MTPRCVMTDRNPDALQHEAPELAIPGLVGKVYDLAPVPEKVRLVSHLLQPLGLFALLAVANGAFAKIWLKNPGQQLQVNPEDVLGVNADDMVALVEFVQQVSLDAVDGLAQIFSMSPVMTGSATVALLVTALLKWKQSRLASTIPR